MCVTKSCEWQQDRLNWLGTGPTPSSGAVNQSEARFTAIYRTMFWYMAHLFLQRNKIINEKITILCICSL